MEALQFAARRLLIHASSPAAVEMAVATFADPAQSWAADPTYQALAAPLADVASVLIGPGAMLCMPFDAAGLPVDTLGADEQALAETLTRGADVQPFAALAVGYTLAGSQTQGKILFQYASSAAAQGDLAMRQFLAEHGLSLITQAPLSKALFTVEDAAVTGSTVVLTVAPREGVAGGSLTWSTVAICSSPHVHRLLNCWWVAAQWRQGCSLALTDWRNLPAALR